MDTILSDPRWRHLLPIPDLDQQHVQPSRPLSIVISVEATLAEQTGAQRLIWLLVTLLSRSTTALTTCIGLDIGDTALLPLVDPRNPDGGSSLVAALTAAAPRFGTQAAPVVPSADVDRPDVVIRLGDGEEARRGTAAHLWVTATEWCGAVTPEKGDAPENDLDSQVPFGPFIAACLAAAQCFMFSRIRDYELQPMALDAWTLSVGSGTRRRRSGIGPGVPRADLDYVLAGAGAVGSALLFTLWSYPGASGHLSVGDCDPEGVDQTNLNRCVPFDFADLGQPKAQVASERLTRSGLTITAFTGDAAHLVGATSHMISAVDKPESRQALQDKYPASIVQASTSGLRLEMLRVDPTAGTACLRCYNPPRPKVADDEVRAVVLGMSEGEIGSHAEALGTDAGTVKQWGREGGCGRVGDLLLERLRPADDAPAQFSVGFASVLAGVLLAGQVIKDCAQRSGEQVDSQPPPPLNGAYARFIFNLLSPPGLLPPVRRYGRDPACPCCKGLRAGVWAKRWTG